MELCFSFYDLFNLIIVVVTQCHLSHCSNVIVVRSNKAASGATPGHKAGLEEWKFFLALRDTELIFTWSGSKNDISSELRACWLKLWQFLSFSALRIIYTVVSGFFRVRKISNYEIREMMTVASNSEDNRFRMSQLYILAQTDCKDLILEQYEYQRSPQVRWCQSLTNCQFEDNDRTTGEIYNYRLQLVAIEPPWPKTFQASQHTMKQTKYDSEMEFILNHCISHIIV